MNSSAAVPVSSFVKDRNKSANIIEHSIVYKYFHLQVKFTSHRGDQMQVQEDDDKTRLLADEQQGQR